jgi:uncharacterized repeat protein (TIGR01451 family)
VVREVGSVGGSARAYAENDRFGRSVAIDGDTVVVGAYNADLGDIIGAGAAYVFTLDGSIWTEQQKLSASDKAGGDYFGRSVAIDGDTIVAGAYRADPGGSNAGAAYVFTRTGSTWTEQQKLTASDKAENDYFGRSVAISGETVVVGAYNADLGDITDAGAAYVFTRTGSTWTEQQTLTASDAAAEDRLGLSVAISGDTVVVGACAADPGGVDRAGAAYVFAAPDADLEVTQMASPTLALINQNLTYTVTVTNNGPDAATDVTVTDTLPASITFVSADAGCAEVSGTVTCTVSSLADGASAAFDIVVTAPGSVMTISNTVTVAAASSDDPVSGNNSTTLSTAVGSPPSVPGISTWGLGVLALMLGAAAFVMRRRTPAWRAGGTRVQKDGVDH